MGTGMGAASPAEAPPGLGAVALLLLALLATVSPQQLQQVVEQPRPGRWPMQHPATVSSRAAVAVQVRAAAR